MSRRIITLFLVLQTAILMAGERYDTRIVDPSVRSLRMRYYSVEDQSALVGPDRCYLTMADGQIDANGDRDGKLIEISFDEMSHDPQQYTYTVVHLDRNYNADDLTSGEYLRGFTSRDITEYELSFNTSRDYTHYSFLFPNEDMTLTASGNYAIVVYRSGYPDSIVLVQRLMVVDPSVSIGAHVSANTDIEFNGRYQQLDLTIGNLTDNDIASTYTFCVRQNGRDDNAVSGIYPTYIESSRLRWQNCRALIFQGGNEYRHIDTYSRVMAGNNVDRIRYDHRDYHAFLEPTLQRSQEIYMHEFDVDGQLRIHAERVTDPDIEAEYMWVHFVLPAEQPYMDGTIYVGGDWNQNRLDNRSRMSYDNENRCYYLTTLLKQGGYDFQYWFVTRDGAVDLQRIEGSHWQTENTYEIVVYHHPVSGRYDQIVGIQYLQTE